MRVLAVDDEKLQLDSLCDAIKGANSSAEIISFLKSGEALEFAKDNHIDVAFLDINMPGIKGIELAKKIKVEQPDVNIVFCTAYEEYAMQAISLRASGYVTKPVSKEAIKRELENLRTPLLNTGVVEIKCFGNFEILIDGKPLNFQRDKSKEVVAYLVDREGALCQNGEIVAAIWDDDDEHISYLQKIRQDIKNTFKEAGHEGIIELSWGKMRIDRTKVKCDYFDWLDGKAEGINAYHGEYMINYSWAEYTNARLQNN